MAIKVADFLIWVKNHLPFIFKPLGKLIAIIFKILLLPPILLVYKNIVLLKIKFKNFQFKHTALINFTRKYLAGIVVSIIIVGTTTSNIFAQNLSTDEYAQRTLLSTIIKSDESNFSDVIEEKANTARKPKTLSYVSDQETLQEPINNNTGSQDAGEVVGLSPDATSLVILNSSEEDFDIPAPTRTSNVEYIVKSGDTLSGIAEQFDVTVNTILWANNLTWNSMIKPGTKLVILPSSGIDYEIKKGDNLNSIAKKYQANLDKILAYNNLNNASEIKVGDLIFIPEGIKPTQVVSSYKQPTVSNKPQSGSNVYSDKEVAPASDLSMNTKFLWPVLSHRITQYYSWRHTGLDIGDKTGNPIYAADDGKVERSGWSTGYGYNVVINHGGGLQTLYGHASQLLVKDGESVSRGQVIALVGSTGWSTGPHLHFEVRVSGSRKNPINYIK